MGFAVPSVAPKTTAVPLGTLNPPMLLELCVRSAVKLDVPLGLTWVGEALMLSTSQGLKFRVDPELSVETVSQPEPPGPPLQPHQLSVTVATFPAPPVSTRPPPVTAVFPVKREFETLSVPSA